MTGDGPGLPAGSVEHLLTAAERATFTEAGFLRIPGALDRATVGHHCEIAARAFEEFRADGANSHAFLNQHDLVGRDPAYLELVDHPTTFPKVFGVLGWNIQLFHTQLVVTPTAHPDAPRGGYAWHQDNNRMNRDFETPAPHPRVSVKIAYFLSDLPAPEMGNFCVVPGSHLAAAVDERDAVQITAVAGDALLFDRRLWHSASANHSAATRMVLFYGYSYRWLRPKSAMEFPDLLAGSGPIRRQLLGAATSPNGYFEPTDADVPLRAWIGEHVGPDAVAP